MAGHKVTEKGRFPNANDKSSSRLEPIIKWPGGKTSELEIIHKYKPQNFNRLLEPFVGGGSVFLSFNAEKNEINDFSSELATLYKFIAEENKSFFSFLNGIEASWTKINSLKKEMMPELKELFVSFCQNEITQQNFEKKVETSFITKEHDWNQIIPRFNCTYNFTSILIKYTRDKMKRMKVISLKKGMLSSYDLELNIETALRSSLYMLYRNLYNRIGIEYTPRKIALFHFLRNFSYSGMFRYNSKGEFNVPYGGIGYNGKNLAKQIEYYQSKDLQTILKKTTIHNQDFQKFLESVKCTSKDFLFLDPPYDSEFSTYANKTFSQDDQRRLANVLIKCRAKWMLIIKNTEFIRSLYENKKNINIIEFDKKYSVSFMNRNEKEVTHLLVRNYV